MRFFNPLSIIFNHTSETLQKIEITYDKEFKHTQSSRFDRYRGEQLKMAFIAACIEAMARTQGVSYSDPYIADEFIIENTTSQ